MHDILDEVFLETEDTPVFSAEEENELVKKCKAGDDSAAILLCRRFYHYIVSVSKEFSKPNISLLDLKQEGLKGLMEAIENYDEQRIPQFRPYAEKQIHQSIINAADNLPQYVLLPDLLEIPFDTPSESEKSATRKKVEELLMPLSEQEQYLMRLRFGLYDGKVLSLEELEKRCGVPREKIRQIEAKMIRMAQSHIHIFKRNLKSFFDEKPKKN